MGQQIYINPPTVLSLTREYRGRLDGLGLPVVINESGKTISAAEVARQAQDACAIVGGLEPFDAHFFETATDLKILAKYGVGYDNVHLPSAQSRNVPVTITTGSNSQSVADLTFASILSLLCRLPERHKAVLSGQWQRSPHPPLAGRTIGIVGFGRIGKLVARHAKSLGWTVLAIDPAYTRVEQLENADALCSLEELLARSDIVTLHYPKDNALVDFDAARIAQMKPGAIFANMARGGLADEAALADALARKRLGGVVLDVFATEPNPDVGRWQDLGNVILTPHVGGSSVDAVRLGFEMCLEAVEHALGLRGEPPRAQFISGPYVTA